MNRILDDKNIEKAESFNIVKLLKNYYPQIILTVLAYSAMAFLSFLGVSKNVTVAALVLNDYEIGQIAERTIIAERNLPATMDYPVVVQEGEKVTRKGFPITEDGYRKLEKMANTREYIDYRAYVNTLIYFACLVILWIFLFSPALVAKKVRFKEIVTEVLFFIATYSAALFGSRLPVLSASPYLLCICIPSSLAVFLIAILFGEKSAVMYTIVSVLGILNASDYSLVVTLYSFSTCLASARIVRKIENRIHMVFVSLMIAVLNIVFIFILKIIFNGAFTDGLFLILGIFFNGFISGILTLGLITPLEQLLNTASIFRLMDLSDTNNPVMGKLLITASGTYNHSMMVSRLAEIACKNIGANFMLARVGGYYHDIGKMDKSEYFVENLKDPDENKHGDMNPSLSVSIIRSHVKKGVELAHSLRLPPQVIDIIAEHHGNDVIAYFYNKAAESNPDVSKADFSYSGTPPSSKESAVVMLADVAEAACRTLDNPTPARLEKFIQMLISKKLEEHQLDNSDLTFKELTVVKNTFVDLLSGYYHNRIKYQNQKDPDDVDKSKSGEKKSEKKDTSESDEKNDGDVKAKKGKTNG